MSEPHAKGRSTVAALFVALAVLISPIALLPSNGAPDMEGQPSFPGSQPGGYEAGGTHLASWAGRGCDLRAFADGDGYVEVILRPRDAATDPGALTASALQEMIECSAPPRPGDDSTGAGSSVTYVNRLGAALDAFALKLSLEALEGFLGQAQAYDVYPDMRVSATLDLSVGQVGADQLWEEVDSLGRPVTGTGIVVSVIDTGVNYMHLDLGGGLGPAFKVIGGYDYYNKDADPMDDNGHGTHVAGIVAASGGVTGVAPSAKIMAYRVLGSDGYGSMSNVILAIGASMDPNGDGLTDDHVDVISMSLGSRGEVDDPVCLAVENAIQAGVVVVVAAGNDGPSMGTVSSPGLSPGAVTVGAVDEDGVLAEFSSRGTGSGLMLKPEVSAPGVRILSTVPCSGTKYCSPTGYLSMSGTSMATPHVSGAAALLLQQHPTWTPQQVKSALVDYAGASSSSLWHAGAGNLWVPASADATLFAGDAILGYGLASNPSLSLTVENNGPTATFQVSSYDFRALEMNGTECARQWTNYTAVAPSYVTIQDGSVGTVSVSIDLPAEYVGGYYEGVVSLSSGGRAVAVPVGFAVVSILNVHVLNMGGYEVFDYYGGVYIYSYPDATFSKGVRALGVPSPPASFVLEPGDYSVHAAGHQILYMYSDPYLLSQIVHVPPLEVVEVFLTMSSARQMVLDLETEDGCPIYVKDYRFYARYAGEVNVSFHMTASETLTYGSAYFGLPLSRTIYVSDTPASVGFSITGYSYSRGMYDFMSRNWEHWYEYRTTNSTRFSITSSADLEYLLAWEFDGIGPETPLILSLEPGSYSTHIQRLDIPGAITDVWGARDSQLSMGATAAFFTRRDTGTSINTAFSGMMRTTFVQGVFSHSYYPGSIYSTAFDLEDYISDLSHLLPVTGYPGVYLPDRNHIEPLPVSDTTRSFGTGPYRPGMTTVNTATVFTLVHPILCDQAGARVAGQDTPSLRLLRNGVLVSSADLVEYEAQPNAVRTITLSSSGAYVVEVKYSPGTQICSDTVTRLGFTVPSSDMDPPRIESFIMSQKFVPGMQVPVQVGVSDDGSVSSVELMWRPHGTTSWTAVALTESAPGEFSGSIATSAGNTALDTYVKVIDGPGNYIEYEASNASLAQIPILFELSSSASELEYRNAEAVLTLSGKLTDTAGSPLSAAGAVPIDLFVGERKVAMILDEYVTADSHAHNGTIRFDWHLNPAELFDGPLETIDMEAVIDIGIYERISRKITLTSTASTDPAPSIELISPVDLSLISAGTVISLSITDDDPFTADAYLDGAFLSALSSPWQVSTGSWSDGRHALRVVATDSEGSVSEATFTFDVDASVPCVEILYPSMGFRVPVGSILQASVSDAYLESVTYRIDGGLSQTLASPYSIDMTGWSIGTHTVEITAEDGVGKVTTESVWFEIALSTLVVRVLSPADDSVSRSGVDIEIEVDGQEPAIVRWCEGGVWHELDESMVIPTSGWSEGMHNLIINATDDMNGCDQISFTFTVDDTAPQIVLMSPQNSSFVSEADVIDVSVLDVHFACVGWTLWGTERQSVYPEVSISLGSSPADGYFSLQVFAEDQAGNLASVSFTFAMDSSPPSVSIANLVSGDAIRPGVPLNIVVADAFLEYVQYSIDSKEPSALAYPYDIDVSSLSDGFHTVEVTAADATEKSTTFGMPFYIDSTAPLVTISSEAKFVEGSACTFTAKVSDDFGIDWVWLYCELPGGGFVSMPMVWDGSLYCAVLPDSILWDGMSVYVVAVDRAGNSADTPRLTLAAVAGSADGSSDQAQGIGIFTSSGLTMIVIMVSLCALSLMAVSLYARDRRHGLPTEAVPVGAGTKSSPARVLGPSLPVIEEKRSSRMAASAVGGTGVRGERVSKKQEQETQEPPAPTEVRTEQRPKAASLIESIPDMPVKLSTEVDVGLEDVDYGELIERELILPGREGSVFRDEENGPPRTDFELLREIMDDLGRLGHKKPPF